MYIIVLVFVDQSALDAIRRYRTAFTREQIAKLEKEFLKENYISRYILYFSRIWVLDILI